MAAENSGIARLPSSPSEFRSGWRVVLGAGAGMGTGVALYIYVSSMFIVPVGQAFGWSRGDLALGSMISFVVGAVTLPIVGRLTDRFGFRPVAIVCALGLAGTYLAVGVMPNAYWAYLALMIVGGVFGGGTASLVWTRPVIATFEKNRGLALGFATAGTAIGGMLGPLVLAGVIEQGGWRAGFFALAAITGLIGMPAAIALIGRARERVAEALAEVELSDAPRVADLSLREAARGARFWLLVLAIVCINVPGSGVLGQLSPLLGDLGLGVGEVAAVMSVYAAGLLCGRLLTGFALDRLPAPWVGAATTLVPALGILMLMAPGLSLPLAVAAVALIGAQQGAETDLFAYFISRSFGVKHYGAIYGVIAMAGALSTAAALILFGEVHDATGSYAIAMVIGAVLFALGALAFGAMGATVIPAGGAERRRAGTQES